MSPVLAEERFASTATLIQAVETLLREEFERPAGGPRCVVLSGGRTPLSAYAALAARPPRICPRLYLALADERHVPADSPDSNYGALQPMIEALHLPAEQTLRVHTELSLSAAAERYHVELESFTGAEGEVSLVLLGMGADGHTCSLFGPEDLARADGRYAIPVERHEPPHRVSVTPRFLEKAARIVFLVTGREKAEILRKFMNDPGTVTAGQAVKYCGKVEVWYADVLE